MWTKEEVIALVALAVALIAAVAGIFAVNEAWKRNILIVLLSVTLAASYVFTQRISISGRLHQTEAAIEAEAKRVVAEEAYRRSVEVAEARARAERKKMDEDAAEARLVAAREQALRQERRRLEQEEAQRAAAVEAGRLVQARKWIIGTWSLHGRLGEEIFPKELTFTTDGRLERRPGLDNRYSLVAVDSIATRSWCCEGWIKIESVSADSCILNFGNLRAVARRRT